MDNWPEHRVQAMHEGIYSLPANLTKFALAYNKKVFDQFGVDYPTDDMTWNEVIDLANKVTGEKEGLQYRGLDIAADGHMVGMLDNWLVNAEDEVQFEEREDVKKLFSLIETVADIPGNIPDNDKEISLIHGAMKSIMKEMLRWQYMRVISLLVSRKQQKKVKLIMIT